MTGAERNMDARAEANVISVNIPNGIRAKLEMANSSLLANDLIILPPHERSGTDFYGPGDVNAIRLAHAVGLNAAYLHEAQDREYLHEYSAGWVVEFAIAFSAQVAATNVVGITNYIIARAREAVVNGLHASPAEKVPVRITVANYNRESTGELTLKGLKIEGLTQEAVEALRILVDPHTEINGQLSVSEINAPTDALKEISADQTKDPRQQ